MKTRQIRNEVRDSVKADSNVTNPALQQKINRERKKLNLSSTKITLNELKKTCETNSSVPRDPKDPFVMAYDINDVSDGEDLRYCIIIRFPQSLHRCFLSLKHILIHILKQVFHTFHMQYNLFFVFTFYMLSKKILIAKLLSTNFTSKPSKH